MSSPTPPGGPQPDSASDRPNQGIPAAPEPRVPPGSEGSQSAANETAPAAKLSPEEQMALYEKELKETDWGHQPC